MADKKRVVASRQGSAGSKSKEFNFTKDMIPEMSNGVPQADFLTAYRQQAWNAYENNGLPTTSEEPWRRTDIRRLDAGSFKISAPGSGQPEIPRYLLEPLAGEKHGGQISLTAGEAEVYLDPEIAKQGVLFTDIKTAAVKHPEIMQKILGKIVDVEADKFSAAAGALAQNGVLLYVPKGVAVEAPLHSVLWGPGNGQAYFSHILVWLEENAEATFVHEYASPTEKGQTFHSGIVEVHVGAAARLQFVELQSWGEHVWNFTHERARVEKDGTLDWIFGAIGSHLTKNFSEIDLIGQGATGRMSGFYFTDGNQHLDHDTQQNHNAPDTTSDLLFKGALTGESRSVWQGMIYVAPGAQKTDGFQSNPNLVLSGEARADSIPGLEILADDVRCTHGATVGKISEEEVFYLGARGIPRDEAERLIVEGFFDPVMQRIPFDRVRQRLQKAIVDKLGN